MMTGRHPIQCIVPPHMLEEIAERGNTEQQRMALNTLSVSDAFRAQRLEAAEFVPLVTAEQVTGKDRIVYDAEQTSDLDRRKVRGEGDPPTDDPAADEAYDGAGATYDLYKDIYDRESIDDNGLRLISTVHYQKGYDNAFWNGEQMTYGDGDEDLPPEDRLFNRFTIALDIVGHELTHGVTQFEAKLVYRSQSGALNESF